MTILDPSRLRELDSMHLVVGGDGADDHEFCAVEAASWAAHDKVVTDSPEWMSPVLAAFLRSWNDSLDDEGRQKLKVFLPRLADTAGDGQDEARAWLATDWLARVCAPAWLELAGVTSAAALRALPSITADTVSIAQPVLDASRKRAEAARAAAWAAAGAVLAPTVIELQASALDLLDRMIDPQAAA